MSASPAVSKGRTRPPRRYVRKTPERGAGFEALYAAVILAAVRDARGGKESGNAFDEGESKYDAMRFLRSDWCQMMLDVLGLPDRSVLIARVRKGLPREIVIDLGKAADVEAPRARIKVDLAVQPPLFV